MERATPGIWARNSRQFVRSGKLRPSVILVAEAEMDRWGLGLGPDRLEEIDSARVLARWRLGGQAQTGEDSNNHGRLAPTPVSLVCPLRFVFRHVRLH